MWAETITNHLTQAHSDFKTDVTENRIQEIHLIYIQQKRLETWCFPKCPGEKKLNKIYKIWI